MLVFMIKKWFFDYWDNFYHFVIINIVFIFSLLIPFGLPAWLLSFSPPLSLIVMIIGLLWLGILTSASALYINEIAQFRSPSPKQFPAFLKEGLLYGLLYAGLWALVAFLVYIVLPFYSSLQNFAGGGRSCISLLDIGHLHPCNAVLFSHYGTAG